MHYSKQRREEELRDQLIYLEAEIKRNIEQHAMLTKEKMSIKHELGENNND